MRERLLQPYDRLVAPSLHEEGVVKPLNICMVDGRERKGERVKEAINEGLHGGVQLGDSLCRYLDRGCGSHDAGLPGDGVKRRRSCRSLLTVAEYGNDKCKSTCFMELCGWHDMLFQASLTMVGGRPEPRYRGKSLIRCLAYGPFHDLVHGKPARFCYL